jgi:hypothetical protein
MLSKLLDLFPRIVKEAPEYFGDQQFVQGVIVNLTGSVIEFVMLAVLLPIAWALWKKFASRGPRAVVQMRFMNVYAKLSDIFLDLGSLGSFKDRMPILLQEHDKNPSEKLTKNGFDNSLVQRLFVVKASLLSDIPAYRKLIEGRSLDDLRRYQSECRKLSEDLHRLAGMVNHFPTLQSSILLVDTMVGALGEFMDDAIDGPLGSGMDSWKSYQLVQLIEHIVEFIDHDYRRRDQLIHSVLNWRNFRGVLPMLFLLPFIWTYRVAGIRWAIIRGQRYHDPWASESILDRLKEWKVQNGYSDTRAAAELGIQVSDYQAYENDYKRPTEQAYVDIANRLVKDFRRPQP